VADRLSPIQANYPVPIDFIIVARRLHADAIEVMLGFVWGGYDRLLKDDGFAVSVNDAHLEDEITQALYCRIQDFMRAFDPFSAFVIMHQWPEGEQAKHTGRQPQCDLAFRMIDGNVRSHFTIEAKVIPTDGAVSEYCHEITGNLLTGRYSTYSSEAAMLGYLLSGRPDSTFNAIAKRLNCEMFCVAAFKTRQHRYSNHQRKGLSGDGQTTSFRCHHLILEFPPSRQVANSGALYQTPLLSCSESRDSTAGPGKRPIKPFT
jgi:hypothetical protein